MTLRELKRAGVLFFVPALLFFYPFLTGNTFFVGDRTYSFHPWLTYAAQEIQAGRFPLWNPYSACGEPLVGNPQLMLFNPTALVYWLFPFRVADQLFLLLSQALLSLFTYLLARRWMGHSTHEHSAVHAPALLAALAFAWGGYATSLWEFPSAIGTLSYLPLFFLLGLGQCWPALAIATALALWTGYVQFVYYAVFLGLAGVALSRSRSKTVLGRWHPYTAFSAAVGGGVLLSLVQLLPSWECARQSLRAVMGSAEGQSYLLKPAFLIKLWIPWITNPVALAFQSSPFGSEFWPIQRNWLTTLFLGTGVCLLAFVGFFRSGVRKWGTLAGVTLASVVLACGIEPFFGSVRALVPGFRYLTHFSNASVLFLLCLTLWSTEAAHPRRGRNLLLALFTLALLWTGLSLAVFPAVRTGALHELLGLASLTPAQDRWVMEAGGITSAATLCVAGIWLFFRRQRWAVLWCFTLLELWAFGRTFQPLAPNEFFHRPLALARIMAGSPHRFSISPATMKGQKPMGGNSLVEGYNTLREAFYPNIPLPFRVHQTWSYDVFGFREFGEFRRRLPDRPGASRALDFLGASHMMSTDDLPSPARFLAQSQNALLYTRPTPMERVSVVPRAFALPLPNERLDYLFGPWDPTKEVVVEAPVPDTAGAPVLDFWKDEPGRVTAQGHGTGWMVYSGIYFPGWEAYVNGRRVPLLRANHAFQTVATPETPWRVNLIYRPPLFRAGLLATVLMILGFMAWGTMALSRPRPVE